MSKVLIACGESLRIVATYRVRGLEALGNEIGMSLGW
jgi:hypothetical protein